MGAAKIRLAVAAAAFVAWLAWLAYLVFQSHDSVILSRPQFLVANLHVVAHLSGDAEKPDGKAKILEVIWTADEADKNKTNSEMPIADLDQVGTTQGWIGPRDYILPLLKLKDGRYRLAPIPASPGYPGTNVGRVYPATLQARRQLAEVPRFE